MENIDQLWCFDPSVHVFNFHSVMSHEKKNGEKSRTEICHTDKK